MSHLDNQIHNLSKQAPFNANIHDKTDADKKEPRFNANYGNMEEKSASICQESYGISEKISTLCTNYQA